MRRVFSIIDLQKVFKLVDLFFCSLMIICDMGLINFCVMMVINHGIDVQRMSMI